MPESAKHPMIEVDAHLVARALGLTSAEFQTLMRAGRVRTLSERGVGTDAGLYRLSFYHGKRRFRCVTDASGKVLQSG
ncbi:MAG: hypothetical protein IPO66_07165 [Rhodanobacteraceae bacterium]|nr:hypothetical protein [Rhodanobacteraceae bacterium]